MFQFQPDSERDNFKMKVTVFLLNIQNVASLNIHDAGVYIPVYIYTPITRLLLGLWCLKSPRWIYIGQEKLKRRSVLT